MYNPHPKRKLLADMDKTQLLNMRANDMSNAEIAVAVGCSPTTIYKAIGPMPPEMLSKKRREAGAMGGRAKVGTRSEGGVYSGVQGTQPYAAA